MNGRARTRATAGFTQKQFSPSPSFQVTDIQEITGEGLVWKHASSDSGHSERSQQNLRPVAAARRPLASQKRQVAFREADASRPEVTTCYAEVTERHCSETERNAKGEGHGEG